MSAATIPPPALTLRGLEVYTWIMTSAAILLSFGRYGIRWWFKHKLMWDDLTHFLALVAAIGMSASFQILYPDAFFLTDLERGFGTPISPAATVELWTKDKRVQHALISMFLVSTWLVKITFMLFYRELFKINRKFMIAWWAVLAFVVLSWWAVFGSTVLAACGRVQDMLNFEICTSPDNIATGNKTIMSMCILSVLSDVVIMILPLWMLRTLKVRTGQKLGLALIFSIGIVVVVLDIVRTVKSLAATDFTEVAAYDIAEVTASIIVSALPTYQALSHADRRPSRKASYYKNLNYGSKSNGIKRSQGDTNPLNSDKERSQVHVSRIDQDAYQLHAWNETTERETV